MEDGLGCCTLMMMGGGGEEEEGGGGGGGGGSCSLGGRGVVVLPFLGCCGGGERRRGDTGHFVLSLNSDDCAGFCGAGGAWAWTWTWDCDCDCESLLAVTGTRAGVVVAERLRRPEAGPPRVDLRWGDGLWACWLLFRDVAPLILPDDEVALRG